MKGATELQNTNTRSKCNTNTKYSFHQDAVNKIEWKVQQNYKIQIESQIQIQNTDTNTKYSFHMAAVNKTE